MARAWNDIIDRLRRKRADDDLFAAAQDGVLRLAEHIANDSRRATLFGWMSMHDLCIQQTDVEPFSGPYLRLSPLSSGAVGFRYDNMRRRDRDWYREVPAHAAIDRLEAFFAQLHWF